MFDMIFFFAESRHVIVMVLVAAMIGSVVGWYFFASKAIAAWTHLIDRPMAAQKHPYRDPLRITGILHAKKLVRAAVIVNGALYSSITWCFCVFAISFDRADLRTAFVALVLGSVNIAMVRSAHRLFTGGPDVVRDLRRQIMLRSMLGLLAHGAMVLLLLVTTAGMLDELAFETHGLKGGIGLDTLGEIRELLPSMPIFLGVGVHSVVTWRNLGIVAMAHASGAIALAVLLLALMQATHERFPYSKPWFRKWLALGSTFVVGVLVAFGFRMQSWKEPDGQTIIRSMTDPCALPPLPRDASKVIGTQEIHWMSQSASVRFEVSDVASYKRTIRATWYGGLKRPRVYAESLAPPQWSENVDMYRRQSSYGLKGGSKCDVSMNSANGFVLIRMSASR
jgi:hypothetical protein